jgi:hypothetical protein
MRQCLWHLARRAQNFFGPLSRALPWKTGADNIPHYQEAIKFHKEYVSKVSGRKNKCTQSIYLQCGGGKWFDNIYPACLLCVWVKRFFFTTFRQWSRAKFCLHRGLCTMLSHDLCSGWAAGRLVAAAWCAPRALLHRRISSSATSARDRSQNSRAKESGDQTAFVHRGGLTMPHRMLFALSVLLVSVLSFFALPVDAHMQIIRGN